MNSIALAALAVTNQTPCGQEWGHGSAGILIYDQESAIVSIDSLKTLEDGNMLTCKMALIGGKVIAATVGIEAPYPAGGNANIIYAKELASASLLSADTNAMATGWNTKMAGLLDKAPSWLVAKTPFAQILFVARGLDGGIHASLGWAIVDPASGKVSTQVVDLPDNPGNWIRQPLGIGIQVKRELELDESERAKRAGVPKYADFRFNGVSSIVDYEVRFLEVATEWYPQLIGPPYESVLLDKNGASLISAKQQCR